MEAMATQSVCAKCGGTGWIIVERGSVSAAEACDCRFQGRTARMEERAQIPPLPSPYPAFTVEGHIHPKVREYFSALLPDLHQFHLSEGYKLKDDELMLKIEERWGPRIVKEVCTPLGWKDGRCLVVAVKLVRETCTVGKPPA